MRLQRLVPEEDGVVVEQQLSDREERLLGDGHSEVDAGHLDADMRAQPLDR